MRINNYIELKNKGVIACVRTFPETGDRGSENHDLKKLLIVAMIRF